MAKGMGREENLRIFEAEQAEIAQLGLTPSERRLAEAKAISEFMRRRDPVGFGEVEASVRRRLYSPVGRAAVLRAFRGR